ncbi:hypothetical protein V3C99_006469 [Haemonchus contortus]
MIYELMSIISLCALVTYSIDCAKKQRTPGAGNAVPSSRRAPNDPKSRSIQQPVKSSSQPCSKQEQLQKKRTQTIRKAKTKKDQDTGTGIDEGGYEVCPDMTPSQLAKAANMDDGASGNQLMTLL